MIRSLFFLSLSVAVVLTKDLERNSINEEPDTFQYDAKCLKQSDFTTNVDISTVKGTFDYLGSDSKWKCMKITLGDVTPEDVATIKQRNGNYERFPDLEWDRAIRKLSFTENVNDTLMWQKDNGETVFVGDDRELVPVEFKQHGESILWLVFGSPVAIQVPADIKTRCVAADSKSPYVYPTVVHLSFC